MVEKTGEGQGPVPWKHMGRPTPRNDGQLIVRFGNARTGVTLHSQGHNAGGLLWAL